MTFRLATRSSGPIGIAVLNYLRLVLGVFVVVEYLALVCIGVAVSDTLPL